MKSYTEAQIKAAFKGGVLSEESLFARLNKLNLEPGQWLKGAMTGQYYQVVDPSSNYIQSPEADSILIYNSYLAKLQSSNASFIGPGKLHEPCGRPW